MTVASTFQLFSLTVGLIEIKRKTFLRYFKRKVKAFVFCFQTRKLCEGVVSIWTAGVCVSVKMRTYAREAYRREDILAKVWVN